MRSSGAPRAATSRSEHAAEEPRAQPSVEGAIRHSISRSLETASDQAIGWMDTPPEGVGRHSHHQRLSDTLELMAASLALDDHQRAAFITLLKTLPAEG